jgi:hypothetical protein
MNWTAMNWFDAIAAAFFAVFLFFALCADRAERTDHEEPKKAPKQTTKVARKPDGHKNARTTKEGRLLHQHDSLVGELVRRYKEQFAELSRRHERLYGYKIHLTIVGRKKAIKKLRPEFKVLEGEISRISARIEQLCSYKGLEGFEDQEVQALLAKRRAKSAKGQ